MVRMIILLSFLLTVNLSSSQNIFSGYKHLMHPVNNYIVYQTVSEIIVDGKPDDVSWQKAEWSECFQDIEGDLKPKPLYQTRFKMLWDSQNLYILAELEEPHVWAYYDTHDQIVFHENDFEIFIDPDGDTHNYYELELNARNTLFDLFLHKPYRNGGPADHDWDIRDFQSAIHIEGTINNPSDVDERWYVEVAIPFKSLTFNKDYMQPVDGQHWKINFSRVQWQTEIADGKYLKKKDRNTGKYLSEDNWVWSPQGVINMHFPERWGLAQFSSVSVGSVTEEFRITAGEKHGKYLWLLYYKQKKFNNENGKYAVSLSELELPEKIEIEQGKFVSYKMETTGDEFCAELICTNNVILSINQDGLFQVGNK